MTVVSDTSPLLLLGRADRLSLLSTLYTTIVIPNAVRREIRVQDDAPARRIRAYTERPNADRADARDEIVERVDEGMGPGERAAIATALDVGADLVLLDDQHGRTEARRHGLSVTGTIGVLAEAKERGLIASLRRELDRVREAGLWIDEALTECFESTENEGGTTGRQDSGILRVHISSSLHPPAQ